MARYGTSNDNKEQQDEFGEYEDNVDALGTTSTTMGSKVFWRSIWFVLLLLVTLTIIGSLLLPIILRAKCVKLPSIASGELLIMNEMDPLYIQNINIETPGVLNIVPNTFSPEYQEKDGIVLYSFDESNGLVKLPPKANKNTTLANKFDFRVKAGAAVRGVYSDYNTTLLAATNGTSFTIKTVDKESRVLSCKYVESTFYAPVNHDFSNSLNLVVKSQTDKTAAPSINIAKGVIFSNIETNSLHGETKVVLNAVDYPGAEVQLSTESGKIEVNGQITISSQTEKEIRGTIAGQSISVTPQRIILRSTSGKIVMTAE